MHLRNFVASERGQSLVEVSLLLPLLVFVVLAGADLARAFAIQLAVQNGARAGAEAAAIDFSPSQTLATARAIDEMSRTPALKTSDPSMNITVTFKKSDGVTDCAGTAEPTPADPCFVTVTVRYTFKTVTAWPLIPNTANFNRSTTMRTIKNP
jgi:Flp pilus assembly protein TadG